MDAKHQPLSYSNYVNDRAIIEALRIPQPPPDGQSADTWPTWHTPREQGEPHSMEWSPGQPWPRGRLWSHHEVLFIRTHQAFEVWFAVVLHELSEILRQANDLWEVERITFQKVELGKRIPGGGGFNPGHFPEITAVAESFPNDFVKEQVKLMPTPGRHYMNVAVPKIPTDTLRNWTAALNRAASALRVTIPFWDVLATMTSKQFLEFRGRLRPASGFGSTQFREIEMILGLRELSRPRIEPSGGTTKAGAWGERLPEPMLRPTEKTPPDEAALCFYHHHLPADWPHLARRYREPSLRDLAYTLLNGNVFEWAGNTKFEAAMDEFAALNVRDALSHQDPNSIDESKVADYIQGLGELLSYREADVAAMLEMAPLNEEQSALQSFLDACMNIDAALLNWRDRHIRFVEAMIGRRPGTGGGGVQYLQSTTDPGWAKYFTHAFPCLWQAKSIVQARKPGAS